MSSTPMLSKTMVCGSRSGVGRVVVSGRGVSSAGLGGVVDLGVRLGGDGQAFGVLGLGFEVGGSVVCCGGCRGGGG